MLAEMEHSSSFSSCDKTAPAGVEAKVTRPKAQILAHYRRYDPRRRLDWRWHWAGQLFKCGEEPDPVFDDGWTRRAFDYQRLVDDHPAETLADTMPDIHAACQLSATEGIHRWELDARILARESPETIQSKTGMAATVIECYEAMFFNVNSRIDCASYIESKAIGWCPFDGRDVATFWNHFGYFYGPYFLDKVIDDFRATGKPDYTHLSVDRAWWKGRTRFQRTMDRSFALLMFSVSSLNLTALFRLQRVYRILIEGGETLTRHDDIEDLVDEAMGDLFSTMSEADADAGVEPKEEYVA